MRTRTIFAHENGKTVRKEIKAAYEIGDAVTVDDIKDAIAEYYGAPELDVKGYIGYYTDEGVFCIINSSKALKFLNTEEGQSYIEDEDGDVRYALASAHLDGLDVGYARYAIMEDGEYLIKLLENLLLNKI